MNFTEEEQRIVKADNEKHPNCGYSVFLSQTCTDVNGEMVCDSIRQLQRVCPYKQPSTIYSQQQQYKGKEKMQGFDNFNQPGLNEFHESFDLFKNPFDLFKRVLDSNALDWGFGENIRRDGTSGSPSNGVFVHPGNKPQQPRIPIPGKVVKDSVEEI